MCENMRKTNFLKNHVDDYIHIPKPRVQQVLAFFGMLFFGALSYLNFILMISIGEIFKVGILINSLTPELEYSSWKQLIIFYPIIGEYVLISLTIICLGALFKGGFDKLNSFNKYGLMSGQIVGLMGGIILGLFLGFIMGLFNCLIGSLITGFIILLGFGLVIGLIMGLINEFD